MKGHRIRPLRRPDDFRRCYAVGRAFKNRLAVLHVAPTSNSNGHPHGPPRVGIAVSRKLGNAVVRNKVKRRFKEAVRRLNILGPSGVDIVFSCRVRAKDADYNNIYEAVADLLKRAGFRRQ